MRKDERLMSGEDRSGATAVTALITPTDIIIGNCGTCVCMRVGRVDVCVRICVCLCM